MFKRSVRKAAASIAAAVVVVSGMAGCTSEPGQQLFCEGSPWGESTVSDVHMVMVVGNVANAPAPDLSPTQTEQVRDLVFEDARVDVVSTAGTGYVCTHGQIGLMPVGDPEEVNEQGREATAQENLTAIQRQLVAAPRDNGADLYGALFLAADQLSSVGAAEKYLVVISSGLSDRGPLDMTAPGALGADPAETLAALKSHGTLPDLTGVTAIVLGLGHTSPPQTPLDAASRQLVVDTYATVLEATGAQMLIDPWPLLGDPIDTLGKTVNPVTLEVPAPIETTPSSPEPQAQCTPQTQVFTQAGGVKFNSDEATFVDVDTARAALAPLVAWLKASPNRSVDLAGTTARWGTREGQIAVGLSRAEAVESLLITDGVAPSQIGVVEGLGSYFPEYQDDLDANGRQIPGPAALNRSIRATLHDNC